jgi:hypothetical protein
MVAMVADAAMVVVMEEAVMDTEEGEEEDMVDMDEAVDLLTGWKTCAPLKPLRSTRADRNRSDTFDFTRKEEEKGRIF